MSLYSPFVLVNDANQQEFLDSGLTPESADQAGYTAIHAAASYSHLPLLRFLIKDCNGDINVQDLEGDTPLHMCEIVEVAKGLTAAEAIREEGDFNDLADYLESVTPDITPQNIDTSALAYMEFRAGDGDDDEEDEGEGRSAERIIPAEHANRIEEIIRLEERDGINRDEELRSIVTEAIMRQMGRGANRNGSAPNRRQRRDTNEQ